MRPFALIFTAVTLVGTTLLGTSTAQAAVDPRKSAFFHPICQEAAKASNGLSHDPVSSTNCFGYIQGAKDAHDRFDGKLFCVPKVVSIAQMAQVWTQYMDRDPKVLILPPVTTLYDSLQQAFPCPK